MENGKTKVALIRGDSLNDWEGKMWESLGNDFLVEGFCSKKNLYSQHLSFPVNKLPTNTDNLIVNQFSKFCFGNFQKMYGLENRLKDFDIAHTAEIYYAYTTQAISAKKNNPKLKVVCTVWDNSPSRFEHSYWPVLNKSPLFWVKKMERIIKANAQGVDLFLPVTSQSAELLRDLGVEEKKIKVLSPAIISYGSAQADKIREKYSFGHKKIFLAVNRLVKEKGVYDILNAWKILPHEFISDKLLVLVGSGPEARGIKEFISKEKLNDSVLLVGTMPNAEIRQLHSVAECLILASHETPVWREQFGYVLAEAMSAGTPVVAANSGAIPEVVGGGGLLFKWGDYKDLALKIEQLISDRPQLSIKAKKQSEKFSSQRFIEELINIYRSISSKI